MGEDGGAGGGGSQNLKNLPVILVCTPALLHPRKQTSELSRIALHCLERTLIHHGHSEIRTHFHHERDRGQLHIVCSLEIFAENVQ